MIKNLKAKIIDYYKSVKETLAKTSLKKKILLIVVPFLILFMGVGIGWGFSNKGDDDSNDADVEWSEPEVSEKPTSKEEPKTVSFDTAGTYICGEDFEPGQYYVVLTRLNFAENDKEHLGYATVNASDLYEIWHDVGSKKRVEFQEGESLKFDDNYSPQWEVTLFTKEDYEKSKGNIKNGSNDISSVKKETKEGPLYDDKFITITYDTNSNYFSIKNKTNQDLILQNGDGPTLNGNRLNMYDGFASVDVPANGKAEETVTLQNDGETIGGQKLREYSFIKSGENTLHISGEILDADYNTLGNYSFDVKLDSNNLKK